MGNQSSLVQAAFDDSVQAYGTATAPGAGADLCSVVLSPGTWEIRAAGRLGLGGAPAAGDNDNMRIRDNTGGVNLLTLQVAAVQNGEPYPVVIKKKFTVASTVVIEAIGAGTAAVVYSAQLVATKISD